MHAFNQRILAEDLVRVRRPDDRERYAAAQRQARIDPNPHQIDAVIFALRRLREGGCILADEVGLGKTIEAGLVIAQSRAEGAQRILLIVPKSLIGQWQGELLNLFGIQARENEASFFAPGVYLVGREFAGSERGATPLGAVPPFDLAVIDEAHEIFAGLHKRYGRDGIYDESSDEALMAHRVRGFLRSTPVLLLTATPMQNSLAELWGLVQYVEPTGTLLGDIATFRKVFCSEDDRTLVPGQEHELKRRLAMVQRRTLRRQAQEFLDRPFTQRRCRLYEYAMSDAERSLYDDVTEYLLEPSLYAFAGRQRRLLLIGFHRRMASSISALAASLENVAARLRRLQAGLGSDDTVINVLRDLEDEDEIEEALRGTGRRRSIVQPSRPSWPASRISSTARDRFRTTPRRAHFRKRSRSFSIWGGTDAAAARPSYSPSRSPPRSTCAACSSLSASARKTSPCSAASTITSVRSKRSPGGEQEEGTRFPPGVRPSREVAMHRVTMAPSPPKIHGELLKLENARQKILHFNVTRHPPRQSRTPKSRPRIAGFSQPFSAPFPALGHQTIAPECIGMEKPCSGNTMPMHRCI